MCLHQQIKQLITLLRSVSVSTWRISAKSLVCGHAGTAGSETYVPKTMDPNEISANHILYMKSLGFKEDSLSDRFPSFHWTAKVHKSPNEHRFIASSLHNKAIVCTPYPNLIYHPKEIVKPVISHIQSHRYQQNMDFEKQL